MKTEKPLPTLKELIGKTIATAEQEMMTTLPDRLLMAFSGNVYERDIDPDTGEPFASFYRWLWVSPPPGVGLCGCPFLGVEDIIREMEKVRDRKPEDSRGTINALIEDLVKGHGAAKKPGRPKKETEDNCGRTPAINGTVRHKKGSASVRARMAESSDPTVREAWTNYLAGKHRSITAAAIACGMVEDANAPLARLKSNWRKASKAERQAFLKFIEEDGE